MILTITLNPCIDKSSTVAKMTPESKLRCTEVVHEAGGGGINVSKALKRLNISSIALFPSGGHNGAMLCSLLRKEQILHHSFETKVETRENWIVLETETNNQFRFTFPGQAIEMEVVSKLVEQIKIFKPNYLVASGSLPIGLSPDFYSQILKEAASFGSKCIIDTSGPALEALSGTKAYLIKPNIGELSRLLGIEHIAKSAVPSAARKVIEKEFSEIVVVSMGGEGAWLVSADEEYFVAAPPVEKKSTVGAGDSMVAGITYALDGGSSLREALAWGVACGSAATMNEGTQLFKASDARVQFDKIINGGTLIP
jgi:6-phosphofructokinase 2